MAAALSEGDPLQRVARDRRWRRRPGLLPLDEPGQLRVGARLRDAIRSHRRRPQDVGASDQAKWAPVRAHRAGQLPATRLSPVNRRSGFFAAGAIVLGSVLLLSLAWGLQHAALNRPALIGNTAPRLAIQTLAGSQVQVWALRGKP